MWWLPKRWTNANGQSTLGEEKMTPEMFCTMHSFIWICTHLQCSVHTTSTILIAFPIESDVEHNKSNIVHRHNTWHSSRQAFIPYFVCSLSINVTHIRPSIRSGDNKCIFYCKWHESPFVRAHMHRIHLLIWAQAMAFVPIWPKNSSKSTVHWLAHSPPREMHTPATNRSSWTSLLIDTCNGLIRHCFGS